MGKIIDIKNQRIGRLIATDYIPTKGWLCQCDCGNTKIVRYSDLSKVRSCGCLIQERNNSSGIDLVGKTFGKWTVLEYCGVNNGSHSICMCKCSCGEIRKVESKSLKNGESQSCGCLYNDNDHLTRKRNFTGYKHITGGMWSALKWQATRRRIPFEITIEDAYALFENQNGRCIYTGDCLTWGLRRANIHRTASLDRIDSSLNYTKENCQWIHTNINIMKWDFNEDYFLFLCNGVVNKSGATLPDFDYSINFSKSIWKLLKSSAKVRGWTWEFDYKYITDLLLLQRYRCHYTHMPIFIPLVNKNRHQITASVDRIDSSKRYIKGNVQWVHKDINLMKLDFSDLEFTELCQKIIGHKKYE